jgi:hypothetical protein
LKLWKHLYWLCVFEYHLYLTVYQTVVLSCFKLHLVKVIYILFRHKYFLYYYYLCIFQVRHHKFWFVFCFCDFTTVYTTILKIKRQIKRISSTVFNKIELSTQIQILCCREASQPRFVNSSYIIGRARNCLPFRGTWVHLQFLVGIVLLDLLFGVYAL